MPRPPPAMPAPALEYCCGGGACCAPCGGSGRLSTRPTGAACAGGIEPVASGLPPPNLEESLLQAATPTLISANTAARDHNCAREFRARDATTTQHIPDPLIRGTR